MKYWTAVVLAAGLIAAPAAFTAEKDKKDDPKHLKEGIADHRAMSEAHLNAARCLESGKRRRIAMTSSPGTAKGWLSASIAG